MSKCFHAYIQQGGFSTTLAPNSAPNPQSRPFASQPTSTQVPSSATQPFLLQQTQVQVQAQPSAIQPAFQSTQFTSSQASPLATQPLPPSLQHTPSQDQALPSMTQPPPVSQLYQISDHTSLDTLQLQSLAQAQVLTLSLEVQLPAFLQHMPIRLVWLQLS